MITIHYKKILNYYFIRNKLIASKQKGCYIEKCKKSSYTFKKSSTLVLKPVAEPIVFSKTK